MCNSVDCFNAHFTRQIETSSSFGKGVYPKKTANIELRLPMVDESKTIGTSMIRTLPGSMPRALKHMESEPRPQKAGSV